MVIPPYDVLLQQHNPGFVNSVLALDPGETTGWCVFRGANLLECGQIDTSTMAIGGRNITRLITKFSPDHFVMENYRVYGHKLKEHAGSDVHTSQLIGVIKYIVAATMHEPSLQMAMQAKHFCTNEKLKTWGYWIKGQQHARDAIRHALFYMLFTYVKEQQNGSS